MTNTIEQLEREYHEISKKLSEARRACPPEPIDNFAFNSASGELTLSNLFGNKSELILIHNMGKQCPYCTLWADGFNSLVPHLENAAAFVVASPDSPQIQAEFAESRGWRFRMVSYGSGVAKKLGYEGQDGKYGKFQPGVSGFKKDSSGAIFRTGHTYFGPGDQFCSIWHMLDLIGKSTEHWAPKYSY